MPHRRSAIGSAVSCESCPPQWEQRRWGGTSIMLLICRALRAPHMVCTPIRARAILHSPVKSRQAHALGMLHMAHEPVAYIKSVNTSTCRTGGKVRVQSSELPVSILGSPLQRMYCSAMVPAHLACLHLLATASTRPAGGAPPHNLVCVSSMRLLSGAAAQFPVFKLPSSRAPLTKKVHPEEFHCKAASRVCLASSKNFLQS